MTNYDRICSAMTDAKTYRYEKADGSHMHAVFVPPILQRVNELKPKRILDLGCGNGALCRSIKKAGHDIVGCDPSEEGVQVAKQAHPDIEFRTLSVYEAVPESWVGAFDMVISTEVVEHLYAPRALAQMTKTVLKPGGTALITTPYHGYLKNLAIALTNKWDSHHDVFWDHGHIKFWSRETLTKLFEDEGFSTISFKGLGRAPWLWMTMLMEFRHGPKDGIVA